MSAVTAVPLRPLAKGSMLKVWLALIVLCVAGGALAWVGTSHAQRTTTASGLQYQVIREGEGDLVTSNDALRIHLVGRRENGEIFASTLNSQPEERTTDRFIPGLGEALKLMRKGSRYRVWIPPHLGHQGTPPPTAPFGPNETLTFDIQVIDVAPGAAQMLQMQQLQQMQQMQQMRGGAGGPGGAAGPGGPGGPPGPAGPHGEAPAEPGPPPPTGNRR